MFRESGLLLESDAFNAFNRTNSTSPGTTLSGAGVITASNPPRRLQFGVKLNF